MSGWIKLHRQITQWEWYQDVNTCRLFIHLLLTANHEDKKWRGSVIKRGQRIFGRIKLAEETGLSVQELRTSLDRLKSTSELTIETTNRFSIVTINRYNDFQSTELSNQQDNHPANQQITNKQPQLKNDKNEKKERNDSTVVAPSAPTPAQEARKFFDDEQAREEIIAKLIANGTTEEFARAEVRKFCYYWTERNKSGTKQRWETEKAFEVRRRLSTWLQRASTPFPRSQ